MVILTGIRAGMDRDELVIFGGVFVVVLLCPIIDGLCFDGRRAGSSMLIGWFLEFMFLHDCVWERSSAVIGMFKPRALIGVMSTLTFESTTLSLVAMILIFFMCCEKGEIPWFSWTIGLPAICILIKWSNYIFFPLRAAYTSSGVLGNSKTDGFLTWATFRLAMLSSRQYAFLTDLPALWTVWLSIITAFPIPLIYIVFSFPVNMSFYSTVPLFCII